MFWRRADILLAPGSQTVGLVQHELCRKRDARPFFRLTLSRFQFFHRCCQTTIQMLTSIRKCKLPWFIGSIIVSAIFLIIRLVSLHYALVFVRWSRLARFIRYKMPAFRCIPTGIRESNLEPLSITGLFGLAPIGMYVSDVESNDRSYPILGVSKYTFCAFSQAYDARRYVSTQFGRTGGVFIMDNLMYFQPCYSGLYGNMTLLIICLVIAISSFLFAIVLPIIIWCIGHKGDSVYPRGLIHSRLKKPSSLGDSLQLCSSQPRTCPLEPSMAPKHGWSRSRIGLR